MASATAATRLVALLGHPVGHSVSPQIHNAAFAAARVDAVYVALDVEPGEVDAAVAGLTAMRFLGANVTIPHKRAVYERVPRRTLDAQVAGAANTVYWDGDDLAVDNTDIEGLRRVLLDDVGLTGGEGVLLLGTGGAARAAAVALGELGAGFEVVGRRPDAVAEIEAVARTAGAVIGRVSDPILLVNATPLGMAGETLPDRFLDLAPPQTVLDLVYRAGETPFVAAARHAGATALDGRGMLVGQAASAFERWTGLPAPREAMRQAAEAALQPGAQPGGTTRR